MTNNFVGMTNLDNLTVRVSIQEKGKFRLLVTEDYSDLWTCILEIYSKLFNTAKLKFTVGSKGSQ